MSIKGSFTGVGLQVAIKNEQLVVVAPVEGSPTLVRTSGRHLDATGIDGSSALAPLVYRTVTQASIDNNTVDVNVERPVRRQRHALRSLAHLHQLEVEEPARRDSRLGETMDAIFKIAGLAMTAQSQRVNAVASNLANAESTVSATGTPYRAKQVVFTTVPLDSQAAQGVRVAAVIEVATPLRQVFDPKHPGADAKCYVSLPNVNVVDEMVNMISLARQFDMVRHETRAVTAGSGPSAGSPRP